ncbi:putative RumC-like protein [Azoarcus olearius]|uniref:DNA recombination protein RmuC n=1 Tax=Azoarcus sp. (strain BH72) TaxID=418699 RepID=UPI0008060D33|nr:DNA recombination protein RmuC [Azoarcus olearius]ANQ85950.1 putative RumC-like protein [Azoarcus olearius]
MIDIPLQMTLAALAGLGAGFVLAWLLQRGRGAQALERARLEAEAALAPLRERARLLEAEREALRVERADVLARAEGWREALEKTRAERAVLAERLLAERRNAEEKIALLQQAREALSDQFKALAADILEEKSKRFTEQNQTNIGQLLEPLRERLQAFQGTVEQVYVQEGKDRSALAEQVRQLMELNRALGEDAKNLTRALKGSVKAQGNWGELVLERVLEASGLRKGVEYDTQQSHAREDGSRAQPDVVIHLPEDRHLVVDAKVSLTAYEACVVAEDEAARQLAVRRHLESVRAHIKGLAERNYQQIHGVGSLDFVLMFVPIEPAFMLAVTHDDALFMDAWQKNVLLVGPSTLLFVVRTVAHLWRQEAQGRNAQEIARRGGELYDKLVGFVDDMDALGNRLAQAQKSFDAAYGKFARGRGNLVRQAEMLRELGVTPAKALSPALVERALEDDAADAAPVRPALRVAGDEAG